MKGWKCTEMKQLARGHTGRKWWEQALNMGSLANIAPHSGWPFPSRLDTGVEAEVDE